MRERILVVGGGPAALAAVRGYREAGGTGELALITDDDRPPYERPQLSKSFLRGETDEDELPLEPAAFYARHEVELVTATATGLDADARVVTLGDGEQRRYDGLVLATGSAPLTLPGAELAHVHVLRSAADAVGLRAAARSARRVVVVGTGFIGCEAAVSLARTGLDVTIVGQEAIPHAPRIGDAAGERVAGWLAEAGVADRHGRVVEGIDADGVQLDGEHLDADVVLLALGVRPRDELARGAGLRLGTGGQAVAADAGQRTTGDGVYAAGDCCEAWHPVAGRPLRVEHWGDALGQGTVAGRRLAGDHDARWAAVPGFWSEIGDHWLKHAAWGDGFATARLVDHAHGWTVWYADEDGTCVGVLACAADADYDRGRALIAAGGPCPTSTGPSRT